MTDLRPLLEDEPSAAERLLIASARRDRPPPGGRARALTGLGFAVGLGATGASGGAAAATLGVWGVSKWVATGAFIGAVVATSAEVVVYRVWGGPRAVTTVARIDVAPPRAHAVPATEPAPRKTDTPEPNVELRKEAPPVVPSSAGQRTPRRVEVPAVQEAPRSLSDEIETLDGVRRALSAGQAPQALALLDVYDSEFKAPSLSQEAAVMRIEALHGVGRDRDAARLGERLLAADPNSAHAKRVRSLLASLPELR